jgi:Fe-S-cluster containining protein
LDAHKNFAMNSVAAQHAQADAYVRRCYTARPELTPCCTAGCHACCSEPVYASQAEVAHIVETLTPRQIAEVKFLLPQWLQHTQPIMSQNMPDAVAYRALNVPCVLLDPGLGLCTVYPRRPLSCRTWFALTNPAACDLPARSHQKYANFSPGIFYATGIPVAVNGMVIMDHLGVLLAEKLLGLDIPSASRKFSPLHKLKMPYRGL